MPLFLLLLLAQYFGVLLLFLLLLFLHLAFFLEQSAFILSLLTDVIFHDFSPFLLQLIYLLFSNVFILPFLSLFFILQMLNVVYRGMRWLSSLNLKLMINILLVVVEGTPLSTGRFFLSCVSHMDYLATISRFDIQSIKFLKHIVGSTNWVDILLNLTLCFLARHFERLVPIRVCLYLLILRLRHLNCVIIKPRRFTTILTFLVINRTLCRLLRLVRLFPRFLTIEA